MCNPTSSPSSSLAQYRQNYRARPTLQFLHRATAGLSLLAALLVPEAVSAEEFLSPDSEGRIPQWLVLGAFSNNEGCTPSLPPLIDEVNAAPQPGLCQAGRKWQVYEGIETKCPNFACSLVGVDLNCFYSGNQQSQGVPDFVRAYTFVYVHAPTTREAHIRYSSDDGSLIILNGLVVADRRFTECHCYGHEHVDPVTLNEGVNRLLMSIGEGIKQWGYNLRFTQTDGLAMTDLLFSLGDPFIDADLDGDGIGDSCDNCPDVANADQNNRDGDALGDACDPDNDNDGVADVADNCPLHFNPDQRDFDGDGLGDVCDVDDDGDGVIDGIDRCLFTPAGEVVDSTGCSIAQYCPCQGEWMSHGHYIACVSRRAHEFHNQGLITADEIAAVVTEAAQSTCGEN